MKRLITCKFGQLGIDDDYCAYLQLVHFSAYYAWQLLLFLDISLHVLASEVENVSLET